MMKHWYGITDKKEFDKYYDIILSGDVDEIEVLLDKDATEVGNTFHKVLITAIVYKHRYYPAMQHICAYSLNGHVLSKLASKTLKRLDKQVKSFNLVICSKCLFRPIKVDKIWVCPLCNKSLHLVHSIKSVMCVVADDDLEDTIDGGVLFARYRNHNRIFYFNDVEIISTDDGLLHMFLMQYNNDISVLGKKRVVCHLKSEVSPNVRANLVEAFGDKLWEE